MEAIDALLSLSEADAMSLASHAAALLVAGYIGSLIRRALR